MSITLINRDYQQKVDSSIQKLLDDISGFEFITPNGLLFKMSDINRTVPIYLDNEKSRIEENEMTWRELNSSIDRLEYEKEYLKNKENRTREESQRFEYLFGPIRQLKEAREDHLEKNANPSPSDKVTIKKEIILKGYYTHHGRSHCPEIVLLMETLGNECYNAESVAITLIHEMFHAFYDYELRRNAPCIPFVEEPLTEYAMLKFVEALAKKDNGYDSMFRSAKNEVLWKKLSFGLAHYSFGYFLWESEGKSGKTLENIHWIEVFRDAKYRISDSSLDYNEYVRPFRQGLYPFGNEQYQMELLRVVLLNALLYANGVRLPLPENGNLSVVWKECGSNSHWAVDGNTLYLDGDFSRRALSYRSHDIFFHHHSQDTSSWEDLYGLKKITQLVLWDHFISDYFYQINHLLSHLSFRNGPVHIMVSPRNVDYVEIDGSIYDASKTTLFHCLASATQIDIPDGVKEICSSAFFDCSSLRHLTIPDSMEIIPDGAFRDCELLEDDIIFDKKLLCVPKNATEYVVPNGVREFDYYAFYHCGALQHVTIPQSVEEIPDGTFHACESLEDEIVFKECLHCVPRTAEQYAIPDNVKEISSDAFDDCTALRRVRIPSSIIEINTGTFFDCQNLVTVTIEEGLEEIGYNTFHGCALTKVILPASLNKMNSGAFANCPLQALTFKGVTPPEVDEPNNLQHECILYVPAGSKDKYKIVFPNHSIVEKRKEEI